MAANGEVLARLRRRSVEVLPRATAGRWPTSCTAPRTWGWRRASSSRRWRQGGKAAARLQAAAPRQHARGPSPRWATRRRRSSTRWRRTAAAAARLASSRRPSPTRCGRLRRRATRRRRCSTRWRRRRRGGCATSSRSTSPTRCGRLRRRCHAAPALFIAVAEDGGAAARLQCARPRQHGVGVRGGRRAPPAVHRRPHRAARGQVSRSAARTLRQLQQFSLWCELELRLPEAQLLPPALRARCRDALRAVASGTRTSMRREPTRGCSSRWAARWAGSGCRRRRSTRWPRATRSTTRSSTSGSRSRSTARGTLRGRATARGGALQDGAQAAAAGGARLAAARGAVLGVGPALRFVSGSRRRPEAGS